MTPEPAAIREGATGLLTVSQHGKSTTFIPDYDMDKARNLLLEFQELRDDRGVSLKECYREEGFNWYPTMVSYLYWYLFFPYIKYAPLVADWMEGRAEFTWENDGQFKTLMALLGGQACRFTWRQRLHYFLLQWNNRRVARKSLARLLFFRFASNDFRTKEIRRVLDTAGTSYLEVIPAPLTAEIVRGLLKGENNYFFSQPPSMGRGNRFQRRYATGHLDAAKRRLFTAAISVVETSVTSFIVECHHHVRALRHCQAKTFYGLDDVNGYVFPVLYACRRLGMRTIGHQHGAYVKRHAGYIMEGIAPGDFQWFDQVIVWGDYWKQKMQRDSTVYPPDFFTVGSNKFANILPASIPADREPRTVLIPYEFLANTMKVGEYMQKLMELGYHVAFKPRPDSALEEQLDSYCLTPSQREKLKIIAKLDAVALAEIDIVAGTMTTLIYELLPCNKIVWVLETEYRHLFDLVEEGLAHLVRLADLRPPGQMPPALLARTCVPSETLFGAESLSDTLRDKVIGDRVPA